METILKLKVKSKKKIYFRGLSEPIRKINNLLYHKKVEGGGKK